MINTSPLFNSDNSFRAFLFMSILSLLMITESCQTTEQASSLSAGQTIPIQSRQNLNSTLWVQTSVEYAATARQSYLLARIMLNRALADSSWTALPAQAETGNYRKLPPAVILDIDETVLDNSPYEARLLLQEKSYSTESWRAWVREAQAEAVPGALAFTRYAEKQGVEVFYVTNRDAKTEAATRRNLKKLGFPLDPQKDVILTQYERPGWESKKPRRRFIADDYRILLLIGDNFSDFVSGVDTSVAARREIARKYKEYWGTHWIMLPNPMYGSWEAALYNFNYGLKRIEKLRRKYKKLNPAR